jgi:hypothetical protein
MKKLALLALFALTIAAFAGAPVLAANSAMVRVMHASPDAPAVDVCVNGSAAFSNLAFPEATKYAELAAGSYDVAVYATGSNCTGTAVMDAKGLALDAKPYTVLAIGKLAEIKPLVLEDNLQKPEAGNAHVRFVHASPDTPAVDITTKDGTKIFSNIAFGGATDFTPVPAGMYDLQARVAGTDTVGLDVPGVSLEDGKIYTIVATGLLNGEPKLAATVVTYEPTPAPAVVPTTGGEFGLGWGAWAALMAGAVLVIAGLFLRRQVGVVNDK